jgi:hydroxymethylpyrimidine kinase/phosphomethylpyrimidine kinase/thiamine-phosphate diphosphorylase
VLREPVVAIAGMDEPRSLEAMRCGAAGVAVLRGIVASSDLRSTVEGLMNAIEQGEREPPFSPPCLPRPT